SVAALLTRREASAGLALIAAAAIKPAALFLAPFAVITTASPARKRTSSRYASKTAFSAGGARRSAFSRWRPAVTLGVGALAAALVLGLASYLAFGWDWTHAFGLAGENQDRTSHLSLPITLARLLGVDAGPVRAAALLVYAGTLAALL